MNLRGDYSNLIRFTSAKDTAATESRSEVKAGETRTSICGQEARLFYESLISEDAADSTSINEESGYNFRRRRRSPVVDKSQPKRRKRSLEAVDDSCRNKEEISSEISSRHGNELLKNAQCGSVNGVRKCLESGADPDYQDAYGWTALMCATMAGHRKVVEFLVEAGINVELTNNQRKTASDLAKEAKLSSIFEIIASKSVRKKQKVVKNKQNEKFTCEICKREFSETDRKSHEASTVHLFNLRLKPKPDPFLIPESNVGFKIMRKSGWDGERGLGSLGQGQKFPVKTTLKRDRSCLGSEKHSKMKAKVTHFGPNDETSIETVRKKERVMSARTLSKRAQKRKEKKDKEWERNLRLYFNTD